MWKFLSKFAILSKKGALAEWSGAGLQNLSQWFDSATHLFLIPKAKIYILAFIFSFLGLWVFFFGLLAVPSQFRVGIILRYPGDSFGLWNTLS